MVQRWRLHHKTALAGMEGGFSCCCYPKNSSPTFSHIINVGRTQKFLKMLSGLYLKRGFLLLLRAQRLAERGGEGLMQKRHQIPKISTRYFKENSSSPEVSNTQSQGRGAGFGDF